MKTTNEQRVNKLTAQINNNINSNNLISNNKGVVATKNANNTEDSKKVLASLKTSVNNLCNGKAFKGLSFSKETALWLLENRCTCDERRLCFNKLNKCDYEKLVSLITRVQRIFAKECGKSALLKGLTGEQYCIVFDNNLKNFMW